MSIHDSCSQCTTHVGFLPFLYSLFLILTIAPSIYSWTSSSFSASHNRIFNDIRHRQRVLSLNNKILKQSIDHENIDINETDQQNHIPPKVNEPTQNNVIEQQQHTHPPYHHSSEQNLLESTMASYGQELQSR